MKNIEEFIRIKKKLSELEEAISSDIREKVSATEDLPNIKRLSNICVSVPFSVIADNNYILSPEYYNTKTQIKEIIRKIDLFDNDLLRLKSFFEEASKNKYIKKGSEKILLNKNVINTINEILLTLKTIS